MEREQIIEALSRLDAGNEAHWTKDGAPALAALKDITGVELKRADVQAVAPAFMRSNPELPAAIPVKEPEPAVKADAPVVAVSDQAIVEAPPAAAANGMQSGDSMTDEPEEGAEDPESYQGLTRQMNELQEQINVLATQEQGLAHQRRALEIKHHNFAVLVDKKAPAVRFEEQNRGYFQSLAARRIAAAEAAKANPTNMLDKRYQMRRSMRLSNAPQSRS